MAAEEKREGGQERVQELAESGREPPARYIQREEDRPIAAPPPPSPIPVVDVGRLFRSDGEDDDEAGKLRSALESWGMFQAVGHEMLVSFLDEVRDVAKEFFRLPMELKQRYNITEEKSEGYGTDAIMTGDQILDWCDYLYLLVQPEDERKVALWPENPSSFRDILHEFTLKSRKVADHVLRAMAKSLELNEDYFVNEFGDRGVANARFNYYPSCPRPDLVFGIKPHSDGSLITIALLDKDVMGLQVLKDGKWFSVTPLPDALLVNLGDEMEIMSNGIFKSPVHRAVTNSEKARISLAMFFALPPEKELEPAESLVDETRPRLYKKMLMKDYLQAFYQNFLKGKRAIDWARI